MSYAVVLRPFPGPARKMYAPGEHVETSEWKNRESLIEQRYIRAVSSATFKEKRRKGAVPSLPPSRSSSIETTKMKHRRRPVFANIEE